MTRDKCLVRVCLWYKSHLAPSIRSWTPSSLPSRKRGWLGWFRPVSPRDQAASRCATISCELWTINPTLGFYNWINLSLAVDYEAMWGDGFVWRSAKELHGKQQLQIWSFHNLFLGLALMAAQSRWVLLNPLTRFIINPAVTQRWHPVPGEVGCKWFSTSHLKKGIHPHKMVLRLKSNKTGKSRSACIVMGKQLDSEKSCVYF